jgi:DNA polymerase-3 subunit alpha
MDFVSLHSHTTFSYGDGFGMPADHVDRVGQLGMTALAATEHGNVTSAPKHAAACKAAGIKAIFGLEAYTGPADMRQTKTTKKWHQGLLAMNDAGYRNLMQLVTRSWDEGFYGKPTITWPMLTEHNEGLIVLSGCLSSRIATVYAEHGYRRALQVAAGYRDLFGDRYYLEVQRFPRLQKTRELNPVLARIGQALGIPLVATADVHYPFPDDNEMQKVLHTATRGMDNVGEAEASWEYDILLTYPTSDEQILHDLVATDLTYAQAAQAIANTGLIADRCEVELATMPQLQYPYAEEGASSEEELVRRWMAEGWYHRGCNRFPRVQQKAYRERAEWELRQMADKGFLSYILSLADCIRYAKRQGIAVGPGRGSGAASLLLWLLRITEIDSLQFPLMLFERFVAPDRYDIPDVDIDFESDRRDEVRLYCERKYGKDRVGNVGTLTYYRGKKSVDTIGRTHQVPYMVTKKAKEMLLDDAGMDASVRSDSTIAATRELFPVVEQIFTDYPALQLAERLEGNVAGFGVHAAGIVIGAEPLSNYAATYSKDVGEGKKKKRVEVLSVDKYDGEPLGLMKYDFLGLKTMSIIKDAAAAVGMTMEEVYRIPLDDPETMAGFCRGEVGGVFQFEGSITRDICVEVQPREFMDLSHITALARPGPLHGGSTADFIRSRNGQRRDRWPDAVEAVVASTEGEIVYQEQVISMAKEVGGFDSVQASKIRSIISKKKGQVAFQEHYPAFLAGAQERGVPEAYAAAIWRKMITSGTYSFNAAHSVSYSVLSVWCMWFRVHHPLQFFWARLKHNVKEVNTKTKVPVTETILKDMAASTNIEVLPLDVHHSGASWQIEGDALRPGYMQVKGIGEKDSDAIVAWLSTQQSLLGLSWDDLLEVRGIGPTRRDQIVAFAQSEDPFEIGKIGRNTLAIQEAIMRAELVSPDGEMLPEITKWSSDIPYAAGRWDGVLLGVVQEIEHRDLFESHKNRTGKDLDPADVKDPHLSTSVAIYLEDLRGRFKVNVGRFTYPKYASTIAEIRVGEEYLLVKVGKSDSFPGKTTFVNEMWAIVPDER